MAIKVPWFFSCSHFVTNKITNLRQHRLYYLLNNHFKVTIPTSCQPQCICNSTTFTFTTSHYYPQHPVDYTNNIAPKSVSIATLVKEAEEHVNVIRVNFLCFLGEKITKKNYLKFKSQNLI